MTQTQPAKLYTAGHDADDIDVIITARRAAAGLPAITAQPDPEARDMWSDGDE